MSTMRALVLTMVAAVTLGLFMAGCGPSICTGTNCVCPEGQSCAFDVCNSGTPGCNYSCGTKATCTGSCGTGCSVTCSGTSCTHSVGINSNIVCSTGTCNITCEGACTVASSGTLNLTCQGGTTQGAAGCQ